MSSSNTLMRRYCLVSVQSPPRCSPARCSATSTAFRARGNRSGNCSMPSPWVCFDRHCSTMAWAAGRGIHTGQFLLRFLQPACADRLRDRFVGHGIRPAGRFPQLSVDEGGEADVSPSVAVAKRAQTTLSGTRAPHRHGCGPAFGDRHHHARGQGRDAIGDERFGACHSQRQVTRGRDRPGQRDLQMRHEDGARQAAPAQNDDSSGQQPVGGNRRLRQNKLGPQRTKRPRQASPAAATSSSGMPTQGTAKVYRTPEKSISSSPSSSAGSAPRIRGSNARREAERRRTEQL